MNQLYNTVGISKQAVYQYSKRQETFDQKVKHLLIEADELRKEHPGCGVEKMYYTLKPEFLGRDKFIDLMMQKGYRVKYQTNYRRTTFASPVCYPNLIKGLKIRAPSVLWQSDITYIAVKEKFCYAVFIIDVYTKKIVGYQVSDHMRATANILALKMAFKSNKPPAIHHSDRGSQYTCDDYIRLLKDNNCAISMALSAQDNAYAERINKTIKEEYLSHWKPQTFEQLKKGLVKAIKHYNNVRPHNSLNKLSPTCFEQKWRSLTNENRPGLTIFDDQIIL